ncbi:MAG: hypothetical protein ACLUG4_07720 [Bacilli bacterium]
MMLESQVFYSALDYFFNYDKIEPKYVRNVNEPVEIGFLTENKVFIKKTYTVDHLK